MHLAKGVLEESRKTQTENELAWASKAFKIRNDKVNVALLGSLEVVLELDKTDIATEKRLELYDKLFLGYNDAIRVTRDEIAHQSKASKGKAAGKAGAAAVSPAAPPAGQENLDHVLKHLTHVKALRTLERNVLLIDTTLARWRAAATAVGEEGQQKQKKAPKPDEMVKLYETVGQVCFQPHPMFYWCQATPFRNRCLALSHTCPRICRSCQRSKSGARRRRSNSQPVSQPIRLGGILSLSLSLFVYSRSLSCSRCYFLALVYGSAGRSSEALALLQSAEAQRGPAQKLLQACSPPRAEDAAQLQQLEGLIRAERFVVTARASLPASGTAAPARRSLPTVHLVSAAVLLLTYKCVELVFARCSQAQPVRNSPAREHPHSRLPSVAVTSGVQADAVRSGAGSVRVPKPGEAEGTNQSWRNLFVLQTRIV
jgi:hypothetical protein